jgi:hypothetical protein
MPTNANRHLQLGGSTTNSLTVPLTELPNTVAFELATTVPVAGDYFAFICYNRTQAALGYQVPAGKTLYILGPANAFASGSLYIVGYGDTSLVAERTATAPTNPVYFAPSATRYVQTLQVAQAGSMYGNYAIPAGKFPFIRVNTTSTFNSGSNILFGILL